MSLRTRGQGRAADGDVGRHRRRLQEAVGLYQAAGAAAAGHSNRGIASELFLSDRTVERHVSTTRSMGVWGKHSPAEAECKQAAK